MKINSNVKYSNNTPLKFKGNNQNASPNNIKINDKDYVIIPKKQDKINHIAEIFLLITSIIGIAGLVLRPPR